MVDWNPFHYIGWKTDLAVATLGVADLARSKADVWIVILKNMIQQGLLI